MIKKGMTLILLGLVLVLALAACGSRNNDDNQATTGTENQNQDDTDAPAPPPTPTPSDTATGDVYEAQGFGLPFSTEGEITLFMWSGSGTWLPDIGRNYIPAEQLMAGQDAQVHAAAQAFNQIFPNIQINLYARYGGPNADDITWDQYRENFRMERGFFPDIFTVDNLVDDMVRGMIADLTIFEDDPRVQTFNPALLDLGRINGRLFALPQYLLPWGIYVNYSLAEAQNIDVPPPNWTFDEYLRFVGHSSHAEFYGAMAPLWVLADSGTRDFHYLLANRGPNDPFVRVNSEPTRNILSRLTVNNEHLVWPNSGDIYEFMGENWWWSHRFFRNGRLLTNDGDPWMMGALATPGTDGTATMAGWDIYPRPSTPYMGNHLGVVFDPIAIHNMAMNDGNPELSPEEYRQLAIAFEFVQFMVADTRSWEARANQRFNTGDGMSYALHDSFPMVIGPEFDAQMALWFQAGRQRFADANLMPGFQYVIQLWEDGQVVNFSDKVVPWRHEFEGSSSLIMHEWINKWDAEITGAGDSEPHWIDMLFSRLPDWDRQFNDRFTEAWQAIDNAILTFYPEQVRGGR